MVDFDTLEEPPKKLGQPKVRFSGWLKLFVVITAISACADFYFFHTFSAINVSDYASSAQSSVTSYKGFGMFFDASLALLAISILYFMYLRLRSTKMLVIVTLVWVIIGAGILYSLQSSAITATGGDTSQASTGPASLGALLWLIYWLRSKEVKRIFIA